jgi:hypothetical protein
VVEQVGLPFLFLQRAGRRGMGLIRVWVSIAMKRGFVQCQNLPRLNCLVLRGTRSLFPFLVSSSWALFISTCYKSVVLRDGRRIDVGTERILVGITEGDSGVGSLGVSEFKNEVL